MANTLLTPTQITRKALMILHQKLNFIGNINRQYDDRFAKSGAKIGDTLQVRLPNQYTVRTGATLSAQDTTEQKVDLTVATQKGVDVSFSSAELTMDMDDFADRILEPAMAVLAANIEADALSMYKSVYNTVDNAGSALTFANVLGGSKLLTDNLAPRDNNRSICLNTQGTVDLVDALKGLFQDSNSIAKQYREGMMGRTGGFDFYENTLVPSHTVGDWSGTVLVAGGSQTGASLALDGFTAADQVLKQGDVFTIAGVYRVHPETKTSTGELQQFTVTSDATTVAGTPVTATVAISPSIVTSGALQNVSGAPADNAAITVFGTSSTAHQQALAFHRDAFAFATADLVMPSGVDFAAREVYDGISLRIVRQYDISDDTFPCRIDILYGKQAIRPQLAARIANN